jgi:hypothetical protein
MFKVGDKVIINPNMVVPLLKQIFGDNLNATFEVLEVGDLVNRDPSKDRSDNFNEQHFWVVVRLPDKDTKKVSSAWLVPA